MIPTHLTERTHYGIASMPVGQGNCLDLSIIVSVQKVVIIVGLLDKATNVLLQKRTRRRHCCDVVLLCGQEFSLGFPAPTSVISF